MHAQASELDLCLIEKSKRAPTSGDTERRYRAVGAPQRSAHEENNHTDFCVARSRAIRILGVEWLGLAFRPKSDGGRISGGLHEHTPFR